MINTSKRPAPLLASPKAGSETVALLNVRAMAGLDQCKKGWCRINTDGAKGWVREGSLWGTATRPQCR